MHKRSAAPSIRRAGVVVSETERDSDIWCPQRTSVMERDVANIVREANTKVMSGYHPKSFRVRSEGAAADADCLTLDRSRGQDPRDAEGARDGHEEEQGTL